MNIFLCSHCVECNKRRMSLKPVIVANSRICAIPHPLVFKVIFEKSKHVGLNSIIKSTKQLCSISKSVPFLTSDLKCDLSIRSTSRVSKMMSCPFFHVLHLQIKFPRRSFPTFCSTARLISGCQAHNVCSYLLL